ncbi:hypothetical protein OBBRIDRAFT_474804 [Obba rivulosa]|uniref:Fe2OG dioxygenase domain-containing protein n=1 Tax=Obba rivulosa TaxID=1052685 RepID=A0A8E2ARH5_9APHY|nr:hypothetical protein OBBRIDRAFT_474804 [Obba rivulosa]
MPATTTPFSPDLLDPTSPAYKKARRQHFKTTRNRSPHVDSEWTPFRAAEKKYKALFPPPDLSDVIDLALLDDTRADEVVGGVWRGASDAIPCREIPLKKNGPSLRGKKAYIFPNHPGLVVLPSFVSHDEQRQLVRWALQDHARRPNETNLDVHYVLPEEGLWSRYTSLRAAGEADGELVQPRISTSSEVPPPEPPGPRKLIANEPAGKGNYHELSASPKPPPAPSPTAQPSSVASLVRRLRWANIGWSYHWGTKQYDFAKGRGEIQDDLRRLCKSVIRLVPWEELFGGGNNQEGWDDGSPDWDAWDETYGKSVGVLFNRIQCLERRIEPDAGIVNFYQTRDTLMAHVDRSEVCATSPLVSISLGCAAIFLIGGLTRDVAPTPILLRSGDVVVMSGPACRRAYHGIPRILEGTLPPHLHTSMSGDSWEVYEEYLRRARINVNVRQVFPRGFDPA